MLNKAPVNPNGILVKLQNYIIAILFDIDPGFK